jgi:uncharacterized protein (TIGR02145 family)
MNKSLLLLIFISLIAAGAFSQDGSITNISVAQRTNGSGLVDVYFDLSGQGNSYFMNMKVSFDAGVNYSPITHSSLSGDTGPLAPGSGKHIIWDPTQEHPNRYSPQTKLMVIAYSVENTNSCPGAPNVFDYDGNYYNTVQIGYQCWIKENLNTTRDASGNNISRLCYNNSFENCELYGGLYNWSTVMNGSASSNGNPSGVQGICPNGWHVPSDPEWTELTDYLINTYNDITASNVGNKLKSCRQVSSPLGGDCSTSAHPRWDSNATYYGTNDFGFSALPGGYYSAGSNNYLGYHGYWWSSTKTGYFPWYFFIFYSGGGFFRDCGTIGNSADSFSVRCVKD